MMKKLLAAFAACLALLALGCESDDYDDSIAPSVPTAVKLTTTAYEDDIRTLLIEWENPADKDFSHVEVLDQTGAVVAMVTGESAAIKIDESKYALYDIQNNADAQYRLRSVDKNGNKSATVSLVSCWVMAYFKSEGSYSANNDTTKAQNSLYLATSADGLHYTAANGGSPVLTVPSNVGSGGSCIRDPYIWRKNDGTFVMLATDWTNFYADSVAEYGTTATTNYWGVHSPCVIVSDSEDLIHWTNTRCRVLAKQNDGTVLSGHHMWAPEVVKINKYDSYTDDDEWEYGVIWSGDFSADAVEDGEAADWTNRTYISYTNDFDEFSAPVLFFQDDYTGEVVTEIDASIVACGSGANTNYYMFFKNEASDGKDIAIAWSDSLEPRSFVVLHDGEYISRDAAQQTGVGIEGSWEVYLNGTWWMFGDHYGNTSTTNTTNFYGWSSSDITAAPEEWTRHANDGTYTMPAGTRHATALRVSVAEYKALKSASDFSAD